MPELGLGPCGQKGGGGAENARRQEGLGTDRLGGGGDEEGRGEEDTPTRNLAQELRGQKLFLTRKE